MLSINVIHIREGMVHAKLHAYVRYRPRAPVVLKQKAPSSPRSHTGASEELVSVSNISIVWPSAALIQLCSAPERVFIRGIADA